MECKTTKVEAIAARCHKLVDMSLDDLRMIYPVATNGTIQDAKEATRGISKGELIREILLAEFRD